MTRRVSLMLLLAGSMLLTACAQKNDQQPVEAKKEERYTPPPAQPKNEPAYTAAPADSNTTEFKPAPNDKSSDEQLAPKSSKKSTSKEKSAGGRTYVVKKGDTLSEIAQKFYGDPNKWKRIYDANKSRIKDPKKLQVGTKLVIP